jgi:peptidoglycan/xylan/chitin deacetylase (PgdA/CDA1 family)
MRERVRILIAACCYYSGLVRLALWWKRRSRATLTILNYHRAAGANLPRQLQFLRRHYRLMHLDAALDGLYTMHPVQQPAKGKADRRAPLVITFDDGYLDNYTCAYRLARDMHIPMTIFLIPGYVERGTYFWWLADEYLVEHTRVDTLAIEGRVYRPQQSADRKALAHVIDRNTRAIANVAEREKFLTAMQKLLDVSLPTRQHEDVADTADTSLPLNWTEIREMEQSGWVSYGAHTMHHPILAYLADAAELRTEVLACRLTLEQQLGHTVRTFCYPVGKFEHIGEQAVQAVKDAGYRWALTTIEDVNTAETDPYLLRRLPGDVDVHWLVMAAELAGLLGNLSRIKQKCRLFMKKVRLVRYGCN